MGHTSESWKEKFFGPFWFVVLVPDRQAVSFPDQDLDAVSAAVEEHEQIARLRILPQHFLHQTVQAVEALAHVRGTRAEEDSHLRREV